MSSPLPSFRTGFFTYPWDLFDEGTERVVEMMTRRYMSNAIMVNANYHHARVFRPRSTGPKTRHYNRAIAAFWPQKELYAETDLLPIVEPALADANVLGQTRSACQKHEIDFGVWVVGLHNSSLGEKHPDQCVVNCFGDVYPYALCPSQAQNQQYIMGLVKDIGAQFSPDRIVIEAIGVLGLRHWVHHELFMTQWDETLELLFSICFCPACTNRGAESGLDVDELRQCVRLWANRLLEEERGALSETFRQAEVASLLLEIPGLWAYLQFSSEAVTDMVSQAHTAAHDFNMKLEVIPSSFHRPVSRAWYERASLSSLAKVCDGLLVSSYFSDPAEVEADLRWASYLASDAKLIAGINACSPTQSAASLTAQAAACLKAGCEGVYFYNYGLLNQKRLNWVSQANKTVLGQ